METERPKERETGVDAAALTLDVADVGHDEPGLRRPPVTVCATASKSKDETARRVSHTRARGSIEEGTSVAHLRREGARTGETAARPGSPSSLSLSVCLFAGGGGVGGGGGGARREREEGSGIGERGE